MNRVSYYITLEGLGEDPGTIDVQTLRDLLDGLLDSAGRVLRLSIEGTSTRPGRHPKWLDRSLRFVVTGMESGSTVLPIEVPQLGESAPAVLEQEDLWLEKPSPDDTALSLLGRAVKDIASLNRESQRIDRGVLRAMEEFGGVVRDDRRLRIESENGTQTGFQIDQSHLRNAEELERETPEPRAVVLSGQLDVIDYSNRGFRLKTADDRTLRGAASKDVVDADRLRNLWGKKVTLEGQAHFTPAGRIRFIETRVVREFRDEEALFEKSPAEVEEEARRTKAVSRRELAERDAGKKIDQVRGTWPGDESIDEILAALD